MSRRKVGCLDASGSLVEQTDSPGQDSPVLHRSTVIFKNVKLCREIALLSFIVIDCLTVYLGIISLWTVYIQ